MGIFSYLLIGLIAISIIAMVALSFYGDQCCFEDNFDIEDRQW